MRLELKSTAFKDLLCSMLKMTGMTRVKPYNVLKAISALSPQATIRILKVQVSRSSAIKRLSKTAVE